MRRITLLLLLVAAMPLPACSTAEFARKYACKHREEIKAIIDRGCAIPPQSETAPQ